MTAPEIASFVLIVFLYLEPTRCIAAIAHRRLLVKAATNALRKAYMRAFGTPHARVNWITSSAHVDGIIAPRALGVSLFAIEPSCTTRAQMHGEVGRFLLVFSPTRKIIRAVWALGRMHDDL